MKRKEDNRIDPSSLNRNLQYKEEPRYERNDIYQKPLPVDKSLRVIIFIHNIIIIMNSKIVMAIFIFGCASAQITEAFTLQKIDNSCFNCLCETASNCNTEAGCRGDICGPFAITKDYWTDSGRPTLDHDDRTANETWIRCVNHYGCATTTVQGYMNRYARDCNGDGVIDCDDYIRIHRMGPFGCRGQLDPQYEQNYKLCMGGRTLNSIDANR